MAHIGVDIGTSYSSVCILNENGQPERVKIATGTSVYGDAYSLPSAVFLEQDGRLLIGQAAFASRMRAPHNFKAEFKRDLGQQAPYLLGANAYLPEDLYKEFFIHIKKCVEDYTSDSVTSATVTYPAMFNENKKKLIEKAAKAAGLLEVQLIDEPSAAAYCYLSAGKLSEGDTLLVYDLGGGTFDLALMRVKDGQFVQITQPMGNPRLGGTDFDKLIFNDIMVQIGEDKMAPMKTNPNHFSRFVATTMELAVKAKHHLSSSDVFSDYITVGLDGVDYTLEVSRYNVMITSAIDETMKQVQAILQTAGLKPSDVNKVLLVGGASRTPLVGEMLSRGLGKEPLKDVDPELAVCEGAVVMPVYLRKMAEEEQKKSEEERRKAQETANDQNGYPAGFCPQCHHNNQVGILFCIRCGTRISQNQQQQADAEKKYFLAIERDEQKKLEAEKSKTQETASNQNGYPAGFCPQCRHNNEAGMLFCMRCGMRLPQSQQQQADTEKKYYLTIEREKQIFLWPKIKLIIDDNRHFMLIDAQDTVVELSPGRHSIEFKYYWKTHSFYIYIEQDTRISYGWNRTNGTLRINFFGAKHSVRS